MSRRLAFGAPHLHFRATDSTNARARELAGGGAPIGTVVTAEEQTAGRGRRGRRWFAPPGTALLYSAVLRPLGERPLLPLAVPLAVAEAAEALGAPGCRLKWPNDVWLEERKLGGVLIEGRPAGPDGGWAVIGVGLNLSIEPQEFPEELRAVATSIGGGATVKDALAALNERLAEWVDADPGRVLEAYRARDALEGRRIRWEGGSGLAAGVDSLGHLLVDVGGGAPVALGAGEVHLAVG